VDPQRDVDIYLDEARVKGVNITHIIETHLHADHVSGNLELAARTGAQIYMHENAHAAFPHVALTDGAEVAVGTVKLRALFTPGHTPEHITLAVTDTSRSQEPWFILTGDFLFVGDVGRPDLLGEEASRNLASQLYDSIHNRLLQLPDGLEVYPGHGAGSLCGRSMSAKLSTTVGFERQFNYALQISAKNEFISLMTTDLPSQPPNVPFIKKLNREGPPILGELKAQPLSAAKARRLLKDGAVVVDTRSPTAFGAGHVKGALNVHLASSQFATRLGFLVSPESTIIFVARHEAECLNAMRAATRVGLDHHAGFLTAAEARKLPQERLPQLKVSGLDALLKGGEITVLDVREKSEYDAGHVPGARLLPLGQLSARLAEVPVGRPLAVMCASAMRSSSAGSFLQRNGFKDILNVEGGFDAWQAASLPVE